MLMALNLSATATNLLSSLGSKEYIKIKRSSGGAYDPVAGETTGTTQSTIDCIGVVTSIDNKLIDGTRIKATDKMAILDNSITPVMTDLISFGGFDNTVIQIDEINHAGVTQLWKVICRG